MCVMDTRRCHNTSFRREIVSDPGQNNPPSTNMGTSALSSTMSYLTVVVHVEKNFWGFELD